MAADHDHAAEPGFLDDHVAAREQRAVRNAAHDLDKPRRRPEHKTLALSHRAIEGDTEHLEITVIHRVEADLAEARYCHELRLDAVDRHAAQAVERDAGHVRGTVRAVGLFFDVFGDRRFCVTEGLVLRKLGLRRRHQFVALLDVVDVSDGEAPALLEKRGEDLAVHGETACLHPFAQQPRLQRIVAAERGIAAGEEQIRFSTFLGNCGHGVRDLAVDGGGFRYGHAAGIGQDVKDPVCLGKAHTNAFRRPIGVDRDVVYGLHAGGIVVKNDQRREESLFALPLGGEQRVCPCFVDGWESTQHRCIQVFHVCYLA